MKYFLASPIPSFVTAAMLRWRGPFRSHFGFALVLLVLVVIFVLLVSQLAQGKPNNEGTGSKTGTN